jgi:unsaturated rhamnogalacturonyl hydrolase
MRLLKWALIVAPLITAAALVAASMQTARVEVVNDLAIARANETIEVKRPGVGPFVVRDAAGTEIASQMIGDGVVIFQASFGPKEVRNFTVTPGPPAKAEPRVFGRFVPERSDDFAWENEKIAFRVYGPGLETDPREPLVSSGLDVWCKRTDRLVIDAWYKSGAYHTDTGEGCDCYKVGRGRGCGGTGILTDGGLHPSRNFRTWKVLARGPVRVVFELAYEPWDAGGVKVSEVKRITLDAGTQLNRVRSTFAIRGAESATVAVGLSEPAGSKRLASPENGWIGVWGAAEGQANGHIGTGVVFPPKAKVELKDAADGALVLTRAKTGEPVDYYVGAGWSKAGFADSAAWGTYLAEFAARLKSPLRVTIKGE